MVKPARMKRALRSMFMVCAVAACSTGPEGGETTPSGIDTDDTDTVGHSDTDTGPIEQLVELTRVGEATVDEAYVGTEAYAAADEGGGDVLCRISYDLVSVGTRSDCEPCAWAFDVQVGGAVVETDVDGACLAVFGLDASTVSSLDGEIRGYGYSADYYGHAQVLLTDDLEYWAASTFATYDPETRRFTYEREDGTRAL